MSNCQVHARNQGIRQNNGLNRELHVMPYHHGSSSNVAFSIDFEQKNEHLQSVVGL